LHKICGCFLENLIGGAQLSNISLKILDAILLNRCQPISLTTIALRLLAPTAQAIKRAPQLGRNGLIGCGFTRMIRAVFLKKPNTTVSQFS